ncbi:MAG: hypothetical protein WCP21_23435, partial [Armatimonadota bacterium]
FTMPRLRHDAEWFWSSVGWAGPMVVVLAALLLFYATGWTSARATPFVFWMIVAAPFVRLRETQLVDRSPSLGHGLPR